MARVPKPWYRKSARAYYVHHNGSYVRLGATKAEAHAAFHRLVAGAAPPPTPPPVRTVASLVDRYLDQLRPKVTPRTHAVAVGYLRRFRSDFGAASAAALDPRDVLRFTSTQPWNPSSAWLFLTRLKAAYNWAVAADLLPRSPLRSLRKPSPLSRGRTAVAAPDAYARLRDAAPPHLRDALLALRDTGCRPGEVRAVTAADCDFDGDVWLLARHKTLHRTGEARVVLLTPAVAAVCRRLAATYATGPLFRTRTGRPYPRGGIARRLKALRDRIGVGPVTPYSFRHAFATDALAAGVPDAHVAELLGHRGTHMLHRHYSHLTSRIRELRRGLERVR